MGSLGSLGSLGSWALGLLGSWALGLLGSWALGLLGSWALGLFARRIRQCATSIHLRLDRCLHAMRHAIAQDRTGPHRIGRSDGRVFDRNRAIVTADRITPNRSNTKQHKATRSKPKSIATNRSASCLLALFIESSIYLEIGDPKNNSTFGSRPSTCVDLPKTHLSTRLSIYLSASLNTYLNTCLSTDQWSAQTRT
ncbi:hypothetical protein D7S86_17745 [Pararobbsia silviterrae]|uniref:Uncharacterized protein n=1 Tax=Pararobbsia silviterrae TaxID=1792498 RepID=A0A494XQ19_9BURK|nr:hypothetical protein D7S86_17745 [Pararobbsia silviterrae]